MHWKCYLNFHNLFLYRWACNNKEHLLSYFSLYVSDFLAARSDVIILNRIRYVWKAMFSKIEVLIEEGIWVKKHRHLRMIIITDFKSICSFVFKNKFGDFRKNVRGQILTQVIITVSRFKSADETFSVSYKYTSYLFLVFFKCVFLNISNISLLVLQSFNFSLKNFEC